MIENAANLLVDLLNEGFDISFREALIRLNDGENPYIIITMTRGGITHERAVPLFDISCPEADEVLIAYLRVMEDEMITIKENMA